MCLFKSSLATSQPKQQGRKERRGQSWPSGGFHFSGALPRLPYAYLYTYIHAYICGCIYIEREMSVRSILVCAVLPVCLYVYGQVGGGTNRREHRLHCMYTSVYTTCMSLRVSVSVWCSRVSFLPVASGLCYADRIRRAGTRSTKEKSSAWWKRFFFHDSEMKPSVLRLMLIKPSAFNTLHTLSLFSSSRGRSSPFLDEKVTVCLFSPSVICLRFLRSFRNPRLSGLPSVESPLLFFAAFFPFSWNRTWRSLFLLLVRSAAAYQDKHAVIRHNEKRISTRVFKDSLSRRVFSSSSSSWWWCV